MPLVPPRLILPPPTHLPLSLVPPCPRCHGERVYELELVPSLLPQLAAFGPMECHLDFGVVACFTCVASCGKTDGSDFAVEHLVIQDAL